VRNVGEKPCEEIVKERAKDGPFKNIYDFCKRLPTQVVNMRVLESLNKAGAFLGTGWNRRQVEAVLEKAVAESQLFQRDQRAGQTSLFDMGGWRRTCPEHYERPELPECRTTSLGGGAGGARLYINSHPCGCTGTPRALRHPAGRDGPRSREGEERVLAGVITNVRRSRRRGRPMAFVTWDPAGSCELTASRDLPAEGALMEADMVVIAARRPTPQRAPFVLVRTHAH
jgi:DNA polymerase-3 subunit alpha